MTKVFGRKIILSKRANSRNLFSCVNNRNVSVTPIVSKNIEEWTSGDLRKILFSSAYQYDKSIQEKVKNYLDYKYPDQSHHISITRYL